MKARIDLKNIENIEISASKVVSEEFELENITKQFDLHDCAKIYAFDKILDLKYGENPHQKASLYGFDKEIDYVKLSPLELSYNNVIDMTSALELTAEFYDVAACTIVKHENPCAVALSSDVESAWDKAIDSDPISPFNSTICFSKKIGYSLAKKICAVNPEVIIAPDFEQKALDEFLKCANLVVIQVNTPYKDILNFYDEQIKFTPFGALIQQKDTKDFELSSFKVATKTKPEQKELEDMIFAFKVVKHTKSSAIVVAKDLRTLGISAGQTNRAQSVEFALSKVCDSPKGSVIASDGTIVAIDTVQIAAQNRVHGIIQPAGGSKDSEIIKTCDKYQISMVTTAIRHLKH